MFYQPLLKPEAVASQEKSLTMFQIRTLVGYINLNLQNVIFNRYLICSKFYTGRFYTDRCIYNQISVKYKVHKY